MLTKRDKDLLKYIETYKAISTRQAIDIFFGGLESSCIRRLNQLEESKIISSYKDGKNKVYIFNEGNQISSHDLGIMDFYAWIIKNGGEILEFKKEVRYFNGFIRPDGYIRFLLPYENKKYEINAFLEYDLNHYTDNLKLNTWYEKLARENIIEDFLLIIARPTPGIRYSPTNFDIIYTDLNFNNILNFIV